MMMVDGELIEEQEAAGAAADDLRHILEAIADEEGGGTARRAAEALRLGAAEGRVYGQEYGRPSDAPLTGCALGHIGSVTGWTADERPQVAGWDYHYWRREVYDYSPLEKWVLDILPGDTPDTSPRLAALVGWLDGYLHLSS